MVRILVEALGQPEQHSVDLDDERVLLLGREPDASKVQGFEGLPEALSVRAVTIPSPSVSASQTAAWSSNGELVLRDLGSRNGTWVRLPSDQNVRLRSDSVIRLRLGAPPSQSGPERMPEPARYKDGRDFGAGVADSVKVWLRHHGITANVWVGAPPGEAAGGDGVAGTTVMRLANGEALFVQAVRTVGEEFHETLVQIGRYVCDQNILLSAEDETRSDGMVLASPAIRLVHRRIVEAAAKGTRSTILLGPSGTGKERLAQAYHRRLSRSGALVVVNCATLTRDRLMVDLFGAERGAYTGAQATMIGAVERADGGTLFLDEVGEIPLEVQPQLLRFLETGEYQRLGAIGRSRIADVRIIAATNRDLRQMVREATFRDDLFFRLAMDVIEVPPLSERFADVAAYLQGQMLGGVSAFDALHATGLEALRAWPWQGNFRELVNFVRRLPGAPQRGSLDAVAVRDTLNAGSLAPLRAARAPESEGVAGAEGWIGWMVESARAYAVEFGPSAPATWGDMTVFIEQYLKPRALAHLADVAEARQFEDVQIRDAAERVKADRGTVIKHLRRYFEAMVPAARVPP